MQPAKNNMLLSLAFLFSKNQRVGGSIVSQYPLNPSLGPIAINNGYLQKVSAYVLFVAFSDSSFDEIRALFFNLHQPQNATF